MKVNVITGVGGPAVRQALPTRFQQLLTTAPEADKIYTLLVFSGDKVLVSAVVERALRQLKVEPDSQLLTFGYNFTVEANALLKAQGALIYSLRDYHWTDESFKRIDQ
jgi:hypothetical protein